jgi:hypothetical protein
MPLSFDASNWDEDRLRQEIAIRLPDGWGFNVLPSEEQTHWISSVVDDQKVEVWSSSGLTLQLVLLNLLGWLEVRNTSLSDSSPWVRKRGELNSQRVHDLAYSKVYVQEEVPDLDPVEIDAVVSANSPKVDT